MGSFTHKSMPIHLWDALDVVVLTGITKQTNTERLSETSSQGRHHGSGARRPALPFLQDGFRAGLPRDVQEVRASAAQISLFELGHSFERAGRAPCSLQARACAAANPRRNCASSRSIRESGDPDKLNPSSRRIAADFVCGYIHHGWLPMIAAANVKAYPYALDSTRPSFTVNSSEVDAERPLRHLRPPRGRRPASDCQLPRNLPPVSPTVPDEDRQRGRTLTTSPFRRVSSPATS